MNGNNENTKNNLDQNQDFDEKTEDHAENNEIRTLNGENRTEKEDLILYLFVNRFGFRDFRRC